MMNDKIPQSTHTPPPTPLDGLPDIAQENLTSRYRTLLALLIILAGIGILGWLFVVKSSSKFQPSQIMQEEYTVPNRAPSQPNQPELGEALVVDTAPAQALDIEDHPDLQQLEIQRAQIEMMEKEKQARLAAPVMIVSHTLQAKGQTAHATNAQNALINEFETPTPQVLSAVQQRHRDALLSEGTLIPAVLESAVDSDLPGLIRGIVESPVYSDDGSRVLIEAGSRIIGEYRSHIAQGQTRVFVVWSTLITSKGVRVPLASQGVDSLGRAGVGADVIDRHFWERFGNAALLSLIGAGASNIGVHGQDEANASQAYRQAISQSFATTASDTFETQGRIPPTLHLKPGKAILIFVAHPLNFSKVVKTVEKKLYVS